MCWCSSFPIESKQWQKDALRLSHACKWFCWPHDLASPSSAACVYTTKSSKALLRLQELIPSFVCSLLANFSQAMAGKPVYLKLLPKRTHRTIHAWTSHLLTQNRNGSPPKQRAEPAEAICFAVAWTVRPTSPCLAGPKNRESLESLSHLGCWLNSMPTTRKKRQMGFFALESIIDKHQARGARRAVFFFCEPMSPVQL